MNATSPTLVREKRRQYVWTPQLDALLEQGYRTGRASRRFAFSRIQKLTGWPRQACWDRARKLGLTARRRSPLRRWSTEEDQCLKNFAGTRNIWVIAQKVNRSVAAIRSRLRRIHLSSARVREGLTKSDLAELLGRSKKTIQIWIDRGWLKGCREGTLRVDDTIRFFERDLLEFWQNHPEEILFHRWSREGLAWFLSLLSELAVAGIWQSQPGREPGTICFEDDQNIREISV
jgi:DNA-binding transcriptional regulator YiaG